MTFCVARAVELPINCPVVGVKPRAAPLSPHTATLSWMQLTRKAHCAVEQVGHSSYECRQSFRYATVSAATVEAVPDVRMHPQEWNSQQWMSTIVRGHRCVRLTVPDSA